MRYFEQSILFIGKTIKHNQSISSMLSAHCSSALLSAHFSSAFASNSLQKTKQKHKSNNPMSQPIMDLHWLVFVFFWGGSVIDNCQLIRLQVLCVYDTYPSLGIPLSQDRTSIKWSKNRCQFRAQDFG